MQVIAASNPCPCGFEGDHRKPCTCTDMRKGRYKARLSGPLLDRFDMRLVIHRLSPTALMDPRGEGSVPVRERVIAARLHQGDRGGLNRDLTRDELDELPFDSAAKTTLVQIADGKDMTARGWDRVRKLARTIADLGDCDVVAQRHVIEAVELRGTWE